MSPRTDITEQDIDIVWAVLTRRHGESLVAIERRRESLRLALQCGRWPIDDYRAVAESAIASVKAELETVSREHAALVDVVFKADERIAALLAEQERFTRETVVRVTPDPDTQRRVVAEWLRGGTVGDRYLIPSLWFCAQRGELTFSPSASGRQEGAHGR